MLKASKVQDLGEPRTSQAFKLVVSNHKQTGSLDGTLLFALCLDIQASNTKLHGVPQSLINRKLRHSLLAPSFLTFSPASMALLHYGIFQIIFYVFLLNPSSAFTIPLHGPSTIARSMRHSFVKRQARGVQLNNTYDISYYADLVLGKQTFTVLVDTGSSDLWVAGSVTGSNNTGYNTSINYATNTVQGFIKKTTLQFANYNTTGQAFLEVIPSEKNPEACGIIGLGPSSGSFISNALPTDEGLPVLDHLFMQNRTTPNYFTLLLGRASDATDNYNGSLTVGTILPEYASILNEQKLLMTAVPNTKASDQHLQILLDSDGLIGPDGKAIEFQSSVETTSDKSQATVVLDSGFTLPQLPREVVDAIYGRFHDSEYRHVAGIGGVYVLPCTQEVNLTFNFAGKPYPIHPLDMSLDPSRISLGDMQTAKGEKACIGTFQPFTYDRGVSPSYDIVLGMAFLRNVYALFDYGDFVGNSTDVGQSYIQLLSTTDRAEAHRNFVQVRLDGLDTTGSRTLKSSRSNSRNTIIYIVIGVIAGSILCAVVIFLLHRSSRRRH